MSSRQPLHSKFVGSDQDGPAGRLQETSLHHPLCRATGHCLYISHQSVPGALRPMESTLSRRAVQIARILARIHGVNPGVGSGVGAGDDTWRRPPQLRLLGSELSVESAEAPMGSAEPPLGSAEEPMGSVVGSAEPTVGPTEAPMESAKRLWGRQSRPWGQRSRRSASRPQGRRGHLRDGRSPPGGRRRCPFARAELPTGWRDGVEYPFGKPV